MIAEHMRTARERWERAGTLSGQAQRDAYGRCYHAAQRAASSPGTPAERFEAAFLAAQAARWSGRLDRAERALCRALLELEIEGRDALRALLADVWREMRREET